MPKKVAHIILHLIISLLCISTPTIAQKVETNDYFYILNTQRGLSDNRIMQMLQLPDGRMAIETIKGINIYNGKHFIFIPISPADAQTLPKYKGHYHLYADNQNRLWIKNYQKIACIDLKNNRLIPHPLSLLANKSRNGNIQDIFVDSNREVWCIYDNTITNSQTSQTITLKDTWGNVQDMDIKDEYVYTFHETGVVAAFKNGSLAYISQAYPASTASNYKNTSLVVKTPHGQFYQIRTGYNEKSKKDYSIFLHFNPESKKYETIYTCNYILHTLNMSSDNQALISSQNGYLMFDFKVSKTPKEVHELTLPDGKSLTTGINTVYKDQDGGIWLGTYHDGLIYVSPMLGLFFTIDKPWFQSIRVLSTLVIVLCIALFCIYFLLLKKKKKQEKQQNNTKNTEMIKVSETTEATKAQQEQPKEPAFIIKARELVITHLQDSEYGVEELANDLYMERSGFYRKLTSQTSVTPVAFIRKIRLQQAALMLKEKELSVNEIAEKTGFSSASYFSKCFKKEYGVLPSEYS